jgi:pyruvate/2-oxoglutarate dehydrogenase complex dihydrolipoamide dehydrogenase (E3) component
MITQPLFDGTGKCQAGKFGPAEQMAFHINTYNAWTIHITSIGQYGGNMGNSYDYDMGVIGGGAAGLTVASGSAQLGAKTVLVEKEDQLGGDCLHFGCVPSKTLIKSAHVYHLMKNAAYYGLPGVDPPPVDFGKVSDRIRGVIATIQKHDSEERFCGLGAKVIFGEAAFVDDHTIDVDGRRYSAKNWVIATGSSPATPPIPGLAQTPYITNKEIFYLDRLPGSMVVMGAGPIGIEMAQAFNRLGTRVTVIDRATQILTREDQVMADMVMDVMAAEGVQFELGATIASVNGASGTKEVAITDNKGRPRTLKADILLVAMGRKANVNGLGLDNIDVKFNGRGIEVDQRLRTSQKHIFAAGDVNGGYQFTHAAGYEGGIVVSNAIFRLPRKVDYTFLPWCTYTDPELASIGMNQQAAARAGIQTRIWEEAFKDNDRSLAEGEKTGRIRLIVDDKEKPVGVQILGPRAGELIGEWVAALNGKVKLSTIAGAVHPYPTIGEINKKVVGSLFSPKIFSEKVQKGLKFFFNLKGRACTLTES